MCAGWAENRGIPLLVDTDVLWREKEGCSALFRTVLEVLEV